MRKYGLDKVSFSFVEVESLKGFKYLHVNVLFFGIGKCMSVLVRITHV